MTSACLIRSVALAAGLMGLAHMAVAQHDPGTSPGVAAKVMLRGDAHGIRIPEMRAVRRNDVLSVQVDLQNMGNTDRVMFYRFRWIDNVGNQVGDGESWKQLTVLGQGMQTIKSVALTPVAVDFRLEMNVEGR
jgi:uncharacterized protein YcfL